MHSACQLCVQGQTITRALKTRVAHAATILQYHKYLCQRFEWPFNVIESIDWNTYTTLVKRQGETWPTIVKHLHDISPTGHIAHRNNPSLPHNCPACHDPYEDNQHVLCCSTPSRAQWWSRLLSKLRKWDDSRSDPILIDILQDGLRRYFLSEPLNPDGYPAEYNDVIRTQNNIGWHQLFKARWSTQWSVRQNAYREKFPTSPTLEEGNR